MPEMEQYHIHWPIDADIGVEAWIESAKGKDEAIAITRRRLNLHGVDPALVDGLVCFVYVYPLGNGPMKGAWSKMGADCDWKWSPSRRR